ncbi:MAG TPA: hypothetical protein VNI82_00390 [Candidatus Nitrosotenuis sp.]|nr:hypothetical protein [Candidatus Nitrosotenuis sp.]
MVFGSLAVFNMYIMGLSVGVTIAIIAIGIFGALPYTHEGPFFVRVYKNTRNLIWRIRHGVIYSRKVSDTSKVYTEDGKSVSNPWDIALHSVPLKSGSGTTAQLATFSSPDGRHSTMLTTAGWGGYAMSDPIDASRYMDALLAAFLDTVKQLRPEDRLTMFGIRRHADTTPFATYVSERVHESILTADGTDEQLWEERQNLERNAIVNYGEGFDTITGYVINVARPKYWRLHRLDKLTPAQIHAAPLVQAINRLSTGLHAAGLNDIRLQNLYGVAKAIKSTWSVGNELDRYRTQLADDAARDSKGEFEHFLEAKSLRAGPWPLSRIELHRDHLRMDGSYLRVMWVEQFLPDYAHLGAFDAIYTLPVPVTVSVSCTVLDSKKSNKRHKNTVDAKQVFSGLRRQGGLMQDPRTRKELEESAQSWEMFRSQSSVELDMRMLIVVAGSSLEELEDNESLVANQLQAMRLMPATVVGEEDQLSWFFAALGMKHV